MKSLTLVAAAALALCAGAAQAATTNAFANAGFELNSPPADPPGGATYFASNWLAAPTGNPVLLNTSAANSKTGNNSANLTVPNGFGGSTLFQNSVDHGGMPPLTALNVGETPLLSFWAKGDASPTGNALFSLRYLNDTGGILTNSGNIFFHTSLNSSSFVQISHQGAAIPVGTAAIFLEINTAVGPLLDGRSNSIYIDDIDFQIAAIPEPSTYALMLAGLAGVGLIARRRRQQA